MHPCPFCSCHVRRDDPACPHCDRRLPVTTVRSTAAAALIGLAVACTAGKGSTDDDTDYTLPSGVDYGSPWTDSDTDSDADADVDTDTDSDSAIDSSTETETGASTSTADTGPVVGTGETADTGR